MAPPLPPLPTPPPLPDASQLQQLLAMLAPQAAAQAPQPAAPQPAAPSDVPVDSNGNPIPNTIGGAHNGTTDKTSMVLYGKPFTHSPWQFGR